MDNSQVTDFLCPPDQWISGIYVYNQMCPSFIVAEASSDLYSVTYYNYSYWPMLTDEAFEPFTRYLWPVGSENIIISELEGPGHLNPSVEFMPDGFEDSALNADWNNARTVADLICPHMEILEPFDSRIHVLDDLVEDVENFLPLFARFTGRETPDFW
jgi:hypothetical protein